MKFVLVCDCGAEDFSYDMDKSKFQCLECGLTINEEKAGHELLGEVSDDDDYDDDDNSY